MVTTVVVKGLLFSTLRQVYVKYHQDLGTGLGTEDAAECLPGRISISMELSF